MSVMGSLYSGMAQAQALSAMTDQLRNQSQRQASGLLDGLRDDPMEIFGGYQQHIYSEPSSTFNWKSKEWVEPEKKIREQLQEETDEWLEDALK